MGGAERSEKQSSQPKERPFTSTESSEQSEQDPVSTDPRTEWAEFPSPPLYIFSLPYHIPSCLQLHSLVLGLKVCDSQVLRLKV